MTSLFEFILSIIGGIIIFYYLYYYLEGMPTVKYRVVDDSFWQGRYCAQIWRVWWPFWVSMDGNYYDNVNSFSNVDEAKLLIENRKNKIPLERKVGKKGKTHYTTHNKT